MQPKILVGCPSAQEKKYCLEQYTAGVQALTWKNKDLLIVDNSETPNYARELAQHGFPVIEDKRLPDVKERITHSRNIIREKVLSGNYDYFLSLEQDVIPPPDIIERLLAHNVPVSCGMYFTVYRVNDKPIMRPLLWKTHTATEMTFMNEEVKAAKGKTSMLLPIKATGLGCMLISRSVLEKITFRSTPESFDDIPFCADLEKHNIPLYSDLALICKHIVNIEGQILTLP